MASSEQESLWLLLLPSAPSNDSFDSLKNAYSKAINQSLQSISTASKTSNITHRLDIAIIHSIKRSAKDDPRCSHYSELQRLLGNVYKLLCISFTKLKIDVEFDNEVDVRIVLLDSTQGHGISMFTLQTLATSRQHWKHVSSTEDTQGERLLRSFIHLRKLDSAISVRAPEVSPVDAGSDVSNLGSRQDEDRISTSNTAKPHYSVAVGGTFDHLHLGHKLLLTMTALVIEPDEDRARTLTVGITGDALLKKKQYVEYVQDWDQRQENVRDFLLSILGQGPSAESTERSYNAETKARSVREELRKGLTINYVEIFDPFGPTITDEDISALAISAETRSGGKAVNDRRAEKGWAPLEVFEVDVLDAGEPNECGSRKVDFEDKISSTEIRRKLHLRHAGGSANTE